MANVDVGDVLRVTAHMTLGRGQDCENVFYFRQEGLGAATDTQAISDVSQFLDDFYGFFVGDLNVGLTFIDILFFNVTQARPMVSGLWPTQTTGGSGSHALPAGAAALVGLPTGVLRVRGRKYFGGFTENGNDGDTVNAGVQSNIVSASATLLGSFLGASLHAYLPGVLATGGAFWAFSEAVISGLWAYQRRRRFGVGD